MYAGEWLYSVAACNVSNQSPQSHQIPMRCHSPMESNDTLPALKFSYYNSYLEI